MMEISFNKSERRLVKRAVPYLALLLLLIITGCGAGKNSSYIRANSILEGDYLQLKLKVTNYITAGDHSTFYSE